jgi:hypothetical protein
MALLSLLTGEPVRTKFRNQDFAADLFLVDATITEVPTYESDITEHAVEDGPDVSDHIRPKNISLELEGVISSTPLNLSAQAQGLVSAAGSILGSQLGGFGSAAGAVGGAFAGAALFSEADDPAKVAHDMLTAIWKKRQLVTIVTGLTQYENMAIQSLSFPRDQKTGKQLHFRATLKEVRKVTAKTVAIKKVQPSVKHTAPAKADLGNQSATPAPNVRSSLAVKVGNFFGGGN